MQKTSLILATAGLLALAGCLDTDLERGLAGAAGGAIIAGEVGADPAAGALVGAGAGLLCDDAGICRRTR